MPSLCLAVMVRDEPIRLRRCLESVRDAVDEVVVLDTGSKDETPEVARQAGARVEQIEWPGSFSVGMNTLLDLVRTDWVLRLDSDEWFDSSPKDALRQAIADPKLYGYKLMMRDLLPEGGFREFTIFRMWRSHPKLRYQGAVHENIPNQAIEEAFPGLGVGTLPVFVWHDGYTKGTDAKTHRNLALLDKELEQRPDQPYYQAMRGLMYRDLNDPRAEKYLRGMAEESTLHPEPSTRMLASVYAALLQDAPEGTRDPLLPKMIERAWAWFPDYPSVVWAIALGEMKRGNLEGALRAFLTLERLAETGKYERSIAFDATILGSGLWNALGFLGQQMGRRDLVERAVKRLQAGR